MGDDLRQVLTILHEAGGEGVPSYEIGWEACMTPAINVALNMGYMRYREHSGERYFYLTPAGYQKIGMCHCLPGPICIPVKENSGAGAKIAVAALSPIIS